jgi:hypothetical protein
MRQSSELFDFLASWGTSPSTSDLRRLRSDPILGRGDVWGHKWTLHLRRPWTRALFMGPWVAQAMALDSLAASSGLFGFLAPRTPRRRPLTSDARGQTRYWGGRVRSKMDSTATAALDMGLVQGPWVAQVGALDSPAASSGLFGFAAASRHH